jgi:hypothetical protein
MPLQTERKSAGSVDPLGKDEGDRALLQPPEREGEGRGRSLVEPLNVIHGDEQRTLLCKRPQA